MTCEVNDIYPQFIEIYMYTTRSKDLQTSFKKTSVSVREKKLLPKTRKQERKSVTGQALSCVLALCP